VISAGTVPGEDLLQLEDPPEPCRCRQLLPLLEPDLQEARVLGMRVGLVDTTQVHAGAQAR
jgi:hypothetical protein